jgi:hypothetical protein
MLKNIPGEIDISEERNCYKICRDGRVRAKEIISDQAAQRFEQKQDP